MQTPSPPPTPIVDPDAPLSQRLRIEARQLVWLAAPLVAVNFGTLLTGVVDTAVVGRVGAVELGAVGLGNAVFFVVSVLGMGVMLGLDPLISQALGADEPRRARALLAQGAWLATLLCVPLGLLIVGATLALEPMGVAPDAALLAGDYVYWRLPSLLPFMWLAATRSFLQAHGVTRPMLVSVVIANVLNAPASWLMVLGDEGLVRLGLDPIGLGAGMGVAGAGLASTLSVIVQWLVLVAAVRTLTPDDEDRLARRRPEPSLLIHMLRLGAPIGLMFGFEVGIFAATSVFMGMLGEVELAAHQVAISLASAAFMMPMGIGAAAAVRVGRAIGRGDAAGTRLAGATALGLGGIAMLVSATLFVFQPELLSRLLTDEPEVITTAASLLGVAAIFQVSDGLQAIGAGVLRGAGDTRWPLVANLVGHWLIGLPVGLLLAFELGYGAVGLWWGLCAGLTVVAVALSVRFAMLTRRPIERA